MTKKAEDPTPVQHCPLCDGLGHVTKNTWDNYQGIRRQAHHNWTYEQEQARKKRHTVWSLFGIASVIVALCGLGGHFVWTPYMEVLGQQQETEKELGILKDQADREIREAQMRLTLETSTQAAKSAQAARAFQLQITQDAIVAQMAAIRESQKYTLAAKESADRLRMDTLDSCYKQNGADQCLCLERLQAVYPEAQTSIDSCYRREALRASSVNRE